ncbi:MAG TPA: cadherin-like domain-containing protein, partial [Bacteroidota bacterium]|nr:cadherin-like domain-containing protein [Bacteroidota bacterium]
LVIVLSSQSFATVPTLSTIPRQVIQKNSIGDTVAFQVSDTSVSVDSLLLSVSSSDTVLLPLSNLQLMGSGTNRSLIIVPSLNLTGTATIILTVSDKVTSSSDTIPVKVNAPPRLDTDLPLTVAEGGTATIGSGLLIAVDPDNANNQIIFSLGPDSATDLVPQHGVLLLNGTPLHAGSTFTQAQVNLNELSYRNDGTEIDNDFFGISIQDVDGGIASDNGFTVFHFSINVTLYNHPPMAYDTTYTLALGASLHGTLEGTDPDSPVLRFSLVTNATQGNVIVDSITGNFVFTPNPAAAGVDSFSYQVYDGSLYSVNPGKITLLISALAPNVSNGNGTVQENKTLRTLCGHQIPIFRHCRSSTPLPAGVTWDQQRFLIRSGEHFNIPQIRMFLERIQLFFALITVRKNQATECLS